MNRIAIVVVAVILVGAVLLSTLSPGAAQAIQAAFLNILSPFLRGSSAVQQQLGAVGSGLKTLDQLEAENAQLLTENKELRATNQILRDLEGENNKLRIALDYQQRSVFKLVAARIISRDAATWWSTVVINRGSADGIAPDQPVLDEMGLIGKTTTVGKHDAVVLLITDETCKVAVQVEGTREKGILSGNRTQASPTSSELQINLLSKMANLQPDQKVYSAGVSNGVFPSGILVGTVKSFEVRALDGHAVVTPAVDSSTVEDVFVVVGAK